MTENSPIKEILPKLSPIIATSVFGLSLLDPAPPDPVRLILELTKAWEQNGLGMEGLGLIGVGLCVGATLIYFGLHLFWKLYNKSQESRSSR